MWWYPPTAYPAAPPRCDGLGSGCARHERARRGTAMRSVGRRGLLAAATVAATSAAMILVGAVSAGAAPTGDTGVLRTVTIDNSPGFPTGQQTGNPVGIQT